MIPFFDTPLFLTVKNILIHKIVSYKYHAVVIWDNACRSLDVKLALLKTWLFHVSQLHLNYRLR